MKELTLKEIAEFRILSSTYNTDKENKLPEKIKDLIKSKEADYVNRKLIEEIFRKLKFPYGGVIWVEAEFIIEPPFLTIKIEKHDLAFYNLDKEVNLKISGKTFIHPLKIDALLYKYFPGTRHLEFSTDTPGPFTNFSYKRNGKNKFTSAPEEFNRKFKGEVYIDSEKYYKHIKMLNLPITHNMGILEKIANESLNNPLSNSEYTNHIHLTELASFIHLNGLYKEPALTPKIFDFFAIYSPENIQLVDIKDVRTMNIANRYSKYHKMHFNNKLFPLKDKFTPKNTASISIKTLSNISYFAAIASFFTFWNLYKVSGGINFSSTLFAELKDEMIARVAFDTSLFTILSLEILASIKIFSSPYVTEILNRLNISNKLRNIIKTILLILTIFMFDKLFNSNSFEFIIISIFLIPAMFFLFISFTSRNPIFNITNSLAKLILLLLVLFPLFSSYSDPNSMKGQSCASKIENYQIYKYRYFETNNWADKIEIAILPGSSDKWIDDSKLQIPTKITVDKSELRSLDSCTDEHSTWSEAEYAFEIEKISSSPKLRRMFPDQETSNLVSAKN